MHYTVALHCDALLTEFGGDVIMARKDRDLTRTYSRAQFAAKLRRLADALEDGRPFAIQVAGERLRVPADTRFSIEHERSGKSEELEFQVLWSRP
jgi:amphi-Trp domain-containing protein